MNHKRKFYGRELYGSDLDLCIVSKFPHGVVAIYDYKRNGEGISFAEVILYNALVTVAPVFIIEIENPETGPFVIRRYKTGNPNPDPPAVVFFDTKTKLSDWPAFIKWERELRATYSQRGGWTLE